MVREATGILTPRTLLPNSKLRVPEPESYATVGGYDLPGNRVFAAFYPVDGSSAASACVRTCECVNAFAGVADPAKELARLREALRMVVECATPQASVDKGGRVITYDLDGAWVDKAKAALKGLP